MLSIRAFRSSRIQCRRHSSTVRSFRPVQVLPDAYLETFRKHAFEPGAPALLPRETFQKLPAIEKWFVKWSDEEREAKALNVDYLAEYRDIVVPLELSTEDGEDFDRVEQPLRMFVEASSLPNSTTRIYLAQAPIADLPHGLQTDIRTPDLVQKAGKGDVYDSSIWLGRAPTYTPLHRDPNPNLFVQLAGRKIVRLFKPKAGHGIFARVQEGIGGKASATMRGEEMMRGAEKKALEREVWGNGSAGVAAEGFEAELGSGDGLFIPKGWWHSVKGIGEGMTGSTGGSAE